MGNFVGVNKNNSVLFEDIKENTKDGAENSSDILVSINNLIDKISTNNDLLKQLLLESKITNVHQHSMTDEEVKESDVEQR